MRYDQFMQFGWKVLIPASLAWIMIVATLRVLSLTGAPRAATIAFASTVVLLVMLVNFGFENAKNKKKNAPVAEVSEPEFAVPQLPIKVSTINVSTGQRGDQ
jgi:NADH-quinone oxidoreductase subunit H